MPALARTTQPGFNRGPDLHRLIRANISQTAKTSRSRIRKPTIFAIHRLTDTPPLHPLRPNPHSARATAIHSPSRFRPLEAFGRRPPEPVPPPSAAGIRNPQHKQPLALQKESSIIFAYSHDRHNASASSIEEREVASDTVELRNPSERVEAISMASPHFGGV
jgi:hypothetical protein